MPKAESLYANPNAIADSYSHFRVDERLLLTGHSHQAWPDCGYEAQSQAWCDAAEHVDRKWGFAFEKAKAVACGYARLLDEPGAEVALAASTHELVVRFLSALSFDERRRIVTTDGEFHSIRRQLDRMAEGESIDLIKVSWDPVDTLAARLAEAVDPGTAVVMASYVSFRNAQIMQGLDEVARACERAGAELLVDAYHAMNAVPFSIPKLGLERAYVVGGGYKYCQLGEGNGFLRVPANCGLRPVITGWYAEFATLSGASDGERVAYGPGASRFAGATYDPTSHYRAAAVFDFFEERGLTPELLREVSQHQIALLARRFDDIDADPELITRDRSVPLEGLGGFLTLTSRRAPDSARRRTYVMIS
jgi:selenocysteine lyase/cysteine desulfurase